MKKLCWAITGIVMTTLCACQGRTAENAEPTGDTVEVKVKSASHEEEGDTVLHAMDEQMIHSLDAAQIVD